MLNQMPAVESVQINRIENHDKVFATTESGQEIELHITDQQKRTASSGNPSSISSALNCGYPCKREPTNYSKTTG
ncbi:hypothetical protein [Latilactobacillus curvatus]|uniref:hypothetical protein n=1 Tax=Latilactobacillus curvatus TaxID=28038 RepID=UPI001CBE7E7C|nr:hypothetical protein [Latilactobacillus curvatus]